MLVTQALLRDALTTRTLERDGGVTRCDWNTREHIIEIQDDVYNKAPTWTVEFVAAVGAVFHLVARVALGDASVFRVTLKLVSRTASSEET